MLSGDTFRGVWLRTLWKEMSPPAAADPEKRAFTADPTDGGWATIDAFEGPTGRDAYAGSYAVWMQSPPIVDFDALVASAAAAAKEDSAAAATVTSKAYFADAREVSQVAGAFGKPRGFAGDLVVSGPTAEEQSAANALFAAKFAAAAGVATGATDLGYDVPCCRLTWNRHIDSLPESCPSGVDSAMCFLVPPAGWLSTAGAKLTWDALVEDIAATKKTADGNTCASTHRWRLVEAGEDYWEEWERIVCWPTGHADLNSAAATLTLAKDGSGRVASVDGCFIERGDAVLGEVMGHMQIKPEEGLYQCQMRFRKAE